MLLWLLLPICFTAIGLVGIAAVCVVAVSHGSVNITESFPLISYCGSYQPESCIFSQICNICSLLGYGIKIFLTVKYNKELLIDKLLVVNSKYYCVYVFI
ncbi:unnamed protein product [Arctogadus glacialis]